MVSLYCLRYTAAQLEAFLEAALEAARESTTVSRAYEGSSMTISAENAKQVALDLGAALTSKRAADANKDAVRNLSGDDPLYVGPWRRCAECLHRKGDGALSVGSMFGRGCFRPLFSPIYSQFAQLLSHLHQIPELQALLVYAHGHVSPAGDQGHRTHSGGQQQQGLQRARVVETRCAPVFH
jgi:hypothetical protein